MVSYHYQNASPPAAGLLAVFTQLCNDGFLLATFMRSFSFVINRLCCEGILKHTKLTLVSLYIYIYIYNVNIYTLYIYIYIYIYIYNVDLLYVYIYKFTYHIHFM